MYNSGNTSKNVTGASVVDGTMESADYADNGLSGDKIDGGIISNFQSTGIDDRLPTGKVLTLNTTGADVDGTITCDGFTSTGIDDNATSTAITIDASENVGIGTASPSEKLHVVGGQLKITGAAGGGAAGCVLSGEVLSEFHIRSQDYTGSSYADIVFDSGNGSTTFLERMRIDSSGNVKVNTGNLVIGTSGKGIDFSGVGTAAEILDDYEEGTWTPRLEGATPGTATYSVQTGTYTKVGNKVHVQGYIATTALGTIAGGLTIQGLPFTTSSIANNITAMTIGYAAGLSITAGNSVSAYIGTYRTFAHLYKWSLTTGSESLSEAGWTADGSMFFSAEYIVN
jgi:hypothetical protein